MVTGLRGPSGCGKTTLKAHLLLGYWLAFGAPAAVQAVQFMPAIVFPQLLPVRAVRKPRRDGRPAVRGSAVLPFTHAYDALARATGPGRARRRDRGRRRRDRRRDGRRGRAGGTDAAPAHPAKRFHLCDRGRCGVRFQP